MAISLILAIVILHPSFPGGSTEWLGVFWLTHDMRHLCSVEHTEQKPPDRFLAPATFSCDIPSESIPLSSLSTFW